MHDFQGSSVSRCVVPRGRVATRLRENSSGSIPLGTGGISLPSVIPSQLNSPGQKGQRSDARDRVNDRSAKFVALACGIVNSFLLAAD